MMRKYSSLIAALILALAILSPAKSTQAQKMDDAAIEKAISELIGKMTLEEKAGQMTQITLDVISKRDAKGKVLEPHELSMDSLKVALQEYHVGSMLNVGSHTFSKEHWQEIIAPIQEMATKDTRLKIPVIYGVDAIHGATYTSKSILFPQEIGLAATWNPEIVEKGAMVTAYETRASGIPWNFSPVADLARQPLWSRFFETFGEDPYLCSQLVTAMVKGYQGADPSDKFRLAACLKHFVGYSQPRSGKDRTPAWIPERILREYYLPSFEAGIAAGAQTVMINSGEVNGIPGHANYHLLTEVLRGELGFDGLAVSDWEDLIMLHTVHRVGSTPKEAVAIAINAGVDMSMVPLTPYYKSFHRYVVENVREGKIPEKRIDEAVARILRVKFRIGLFENPIFPLFDYPEFASDKFRGYAYDAAVQSMTLLKNEDDLLPIGKDMKVLVTGPAANSLNILNGAWTHTWQGVETKYNNDRPTIVDAFKTALGEGKVSFELGSELDTLADVPAAVKKARKADIVIVCLGEIPSTEKPGDIVRLDLPDAQIELVKELKKTGKKIIGVLVQNRPQIIHRIADDLDAILLAYQPGDEGGRAVADVITGDKSPGGRLPFTYPRHAGDITHYDYKTADTRDTKFAFDAIDPLYEFGHGLTYTTFGYSNLELDKKSIGPGGSITISVTVKNTGKRKGSEVVQLYVQDEYASIAPPLKRLRGFQRVELDAGQSQKVSFTLKTNDLAFVDLDLKWKTEAGTFKAKVGGLEKGFSVSQDEFFGPFRK